MTKVLHVLGSSPFGGGTRMVLAICRHLRAQGMQVSLITSDPRTTRLFTAAGIVCYPIGDMHREITPLRDLRAVCQLTSFCQQQKFDIVHTHTSKGGFVGRLAARKARVPHVLHTVHGFAFHEASPKYIVIFYAMLEKLAAHWAEKLIFVNEFHRQWALDLGLAPPHKTITITNGIPDNHATVHNAGGSQLRIRFGIPSNVYVIGTIGRLARQKGLEYVIRAMPAILSRYGDIYLLLIGDGELLEEYIGLVQRLGVESRVIFGGFHEDVHAFYDAVDLVVLPSLWEGLSISLLEAMRAGKAIVTTDIGPNRNVVTHAHSAWMVPIRNSDALVDAILTLHDNPDLADRLGRTALRVFQEHYTEGAMLQKVYRLYTELLDKPHVEITPTGD